MGQNNIKNRKKMQAANAQKRNWKLLPLQFVLLVLPLILYLYQGNSGYSEYTWNSLDDSYLDVFLQGKVVAFLIAAAVALVLAVQKTRKLRQEERKQLLCYFIPLLVYFLMVIISTIFSENLSGSLKGAMSQHEPVWVLLGYLVVLFYAYLVIEKPEDWSQLTTAAIIGSCFMAVVGVFQAAGKDLLAMEGVQRLFVNNTFIDTNGPLQLMFPVGQAYGTLFNPNYVGTYVAMLVPLLLAGLFTYKKIWQKAVCGASIIGLMVMLFASQSRTGLIAIAAVFVVMLVFLGRKLWKRWYLVLPGVLLVIIAFIVVDSRRDFQLTKRLKEMFAIEKAQDVLWGIDTTGNGVRVLYKDTEFTVMMPISKNGYAYIAFENDEEREVTYNEEKTYGYFTLSNGDVIAIQTAWYEDGYAFGLNLDGRDYYFTNQVVKGNYKYVNEFGRADECSIPANVLPGYERFASGRGYAWGRTIPLLLDHLLIGSGPDTFAVEFPQTDYVARYKVGFEGIIFTRPHNFYLQMGVQTGVVSLLAFLVFYGIYFVGCCRRYFFCKFQRAEEWGGFAVFLSTVGFMAAGLANDSLIVVSPIFYVLLGAGLAINHKLCPIERKEKRNKEEGQE